MPTKSECVAASLALGVRLTALLSTFVLGACEPHAGAPRFALTQADWSYAGRAGRQLSTDHFEVYTTMDDVALRDFLPTFLESAHRQYTELIPVADSPSTPKLTTYLFATRQEWERFTREHYPARYPVYVRIQSGGYAERNDCVVYYLRRVYTLSVIAHEGFHQYLGAHFVDRMPAWLNEGCACYCETFQIVKDLPVFTPTANAFRANALRDALASDALIPLKELLDTDAGQVIVEGQSRKTSTYYAQAWALVCMLRHSAHGKYAKAFAQIGRDVADRSLGIKANAARIASPNPSATSHGEAVFRAYISNDLEAFEGEYRAYLRELVAF